VRLSAWTALAAIIANLLVQGVRLTGAGLDAFGDPDAIALALGQGGAWSAAVSAVGLVVLVTVAGPLGRGWWLPGTRLAAIGPAAAAAAGGFALSGHAVTSNPRVLVVIANALHSVAGAVWFGGLVAVALLLRGRSDHPDEPSGWRSVVVARFSSLAAASLGAVAVTGVLVAWRIEGSWSRVVAGSRGAVLVAKVLVVAVVAALGAWNRTRLVAAVERQALTLRRVVTLEAALLVVVVGLTASLVIMAPNRALSSTPTGSVSSPVVQMGTPEAGPLEAIVTVEPGRSGMNTIVVKMTSDGEPAREVTEVRLRLTQEDVGVGPLRAVTESTGADTWRSEPVELAVGGVWTVEVFVAVPSGVVTGSTTVTLP
jgi:copper transport protein